MRKSITQLPKRVFVVGCPRSGTTLLQSILLTNPSIISFPESHFLSICFGGAPIFKKSSIWLPPMRDPGLPPLWKSQAIRASAPLCLGTRWA